MGEDMTFFPKFEAYFEGLCKDFPKEYNLNAYYERKSEILGAILFSGMYAEKGLSLGTEADHESYLKRLGLEIKTKNPPEDGGELMALDFKELLKEDYEIPDNWTRILSHLDTLWMFYSLVRPKTIPTNILLKLDVATLQIAFFVQGTISPHLDKIDRTMKLRQSDSGAYKKPFTEAVEHLYLKLFNNGDSDLLQPFNLKPFLERLKKETKKDSYIEERIESVINPRGLCRIKTREHSRPRSKSRKTAIIDGAREYSKTDVSTLLNTLRKKYPIQ